MAYQPIVNVNIAINATPLTQLGFGTPIFFTAHRQSPYRVIEVASAPELTAEPYNFSTGSNAYKAATQVFSQTPSVSTFKVGRVDMSASVSGVATVDLQTTTFTITVSLPDGTGAGYSQVFSEDVTGATVPVIASTFEQAVDNFIVSIEADSQFDGLNVSKQGSLDGAILLISSVGSGDDSLYFTVTSSDENSVINYQAAETPADTVNAVLLEDEDWYFATYEVRSNDGDVIAMKDALGVKDAYMFFYASSDIANLTPYQAGNPDLFSVLRDGNEDRVVTLFHHEAGSDYPELAYVGVNAPFDAGSITWANVQISGLGFSQDPVRGRPLNTTQKSALKNKNANYIEYDAGVSFTRTGVTAGGEWIDVVRGVDWQSADMGTALRAALLNQKGGKIPYTDQGTAVIREIISSSLQRGVNRQFLESYTVYVPAVADISVNDRLSRILTGISFTGYLAGAIHEVTVNGEVTID